MILVNWNVEWKSLKSSKTPEVLKRIWKHKPELVCLTEAYPDLLANRGYVICSERDYGLRPLKGRKVLLWSKNPWRNIDDFGNDLLPPGRFVSGITRTTLGDLLIVGVCIPYKDARRTKGAIIKRKPWQDHKEYLPELGCLLKKLTQTNKRLVLVGDFNQRIGIKHYVPKTYQDLLKSALGSLEIPTRAPNFMFKNQPSIDHIALQGLQVDLPRPMENELDAGKKLGANDSLGHFGVVADLQIIT